MSPSPSRPRVGVSACLLGHPVRYDGGHKRQPRLVGKLADKLELVPVCPEVEAGLGVPRPPMHLARRGSTVSVVVTTTGDDHTAALTLAAQRWLAAHGSSLHGFILKSRSPSCGLRAVPLRIDGRAPTPNGRGLFVAQLLAGNIELPTIDEVGLLDDATAAEFLRLVQGR